MPRTTSARPGAICAANGSSPANDRPADGSDRLSINGIVNAKRTELRLPDQLGLEKWSRVGKQIAIIQNASAWWLGDWIIYGQDKFPDHYRRAVSQSSLDYQTLRNYAWVARRFSVSRRRDNMSFQHHAEVASLEEKEQDLWLDKATHFGWSVSELRKQLRAASVGRRDAAASVTVIVKLNVPAERKQRWEDAAEIENKELPDWIACQMDNAADRVLEDNMGLSSERSTLSGLIMLVTSGI